MYNFASFKPTFITKGYESLYEFFIRLHQFSQTTGRKLIKSRLSWRHSCHAFYTRITGCQGNCYCKMLSFLTGYLSIFTYELYLSLMYAFWNANLCLNIYLFWLFSKALILRMRGCLCSMFSLYVVLGALFLGDKTDPNDWCILYDTFLLHNLLQTHFWVLWSRIHWLSPWFTFTMRRSHVAKRSCNCP